jgi:hypothetical protein
VYHPLPEGQAYAQQQVTGQAQIAQALRAAVSGHSSLGAGTTIASEIGAGHRMSRPLPDVEVLDMEPSHIQRLLIEDGVSGN